MVGLSAHDADYRKPVMESAEDHPLESDLSVSRPAAVGAVDEYPRVVIAAAIEVPVDHRARVSRYPRLGKVVMRPLPRDRWDERSAVVKPNRPPEVAGRTGNGDSKPVNPVEIQRRVAATSSATPSCSDAQPHRGYQQATPETRHLPDAATGDRDATLPSRAMGASGARACRGRCRRRDATVLV